jgi:hypothetical protein
MTSHRTRHRRRERPTTGAQEVFGALRRDDGCEQWRSGQSCPSHRSAEPSVKTGAVGTVGDRVAGGASIVIPTCGAHVCAARAAGQRGQVGRRRYRAPDIQRRLGVGEGIGAGSNPDLDRSPCASTTNLKLVALRTGFDCPEGAARDLLCRRNTRKRHDFRLGLSYECRGG